MHHYLKKTRSWQVQSHSSGLFSFSSDAKTAPFDSLAIDIHKMTKDQPLCEASCRRCVRYSFWKALKSYRRSLNQRICWEEMRKLERMGNMTLLHRNAEMKPESCQEISHWYVTPNEAPPIFGEMPPQTAINSNSRRSCGMHNYQILQLASSPQIWPLASSRHVQEKRSDTYPWVTLSIFPHYQRP